MTRPSVSFDNGFEFEPGELGSHEKAWEEGWQSLPWGLSSPVIKMITHWNAGLGKLLEEHPLYKGLATYGFMSQLGQGLNWWQTTKQGYYITLTGEQLKPGGHDSVRGSHNVLIWKDHQLKSLAGDLIISYQGVMEVQGGRLRRELMKGNRSIEEIRKAIEDGVNPLISRRKLLESLDQAVDGMDMGDQIELAKRTVGAGKGAQPVELSLENIEAMVKGAEKVPGSEHARQLDSLAEQLGVPAKALAKAVKRLRGENPATAADPNFLAKLGDYARRLQGKNPASTTELLAKLRVRCRWTARRQREAHEEEANGCGLSHFRRRSSAHRALPPKHRRHDKRGK